MTVTKSQFKQQTMHFDFPRFSDSGVINVEYKKGIYILYILYYVLYYTYYIENKNGILKWSRNMTINRIELFGWMGFKTD